MNKLSMDKKVAVISALVEGCSVRSTSRMTGVAKNTVTKLLVQAGKVAAEVNSYAAAAAMVALLERMVAYRFELEARGVDRDALVETTARIIHQTVTGDPA